MATPSVNFSTHVVNGATYALQYDLLNDFEPIGLLASNPQVIISKNAVPAKDLKELIAWLRTNPNKASQGTGGVGTVGHVAGVSFQKATDTRFQFVPYRGSPPALQDLMGGQIDLMIDQASANLPHVRAGRIRAYAVTAMKRLNSAPDIPTVDEAGVPGFCICPSGAQFGHPRVHRRISSPSNPPLRMPLARQLSPAADMSQCRRWTAVGRCC
jgi:tripartite-type tricarboxylate transporter receptor subunit TctC